MNPLQALLIFINGVFNGIGESIAFDKAISNYKEAKELYIRQKYKYKIMGLNFVAIRRSKFRYDNTEPGSSGDYASFYISVKDIFPFINRVNQIFDVKSFSKKDKSQWDGKRIIIGSGYILGNDNKYYKVDTNHIKYDHKQPGILSAVWCKTPECHLSDRVVLGHGINENGYFNLHPENGKAYTLVSLNSGEEPNFIIRLLIYLIRLWYDHKSIVIGGFILLLIIWVVISEEEGS